MKSLFSESFTHKKWSIVILSFIVLLTSAGFITYETTKKNVTLNLDGRETVLKTHTTTVQQLLEDLDITLKPQDHVAPRKDTPISNDMNIVWRPAKQVQITEKDSEQTVWTTAQTVEEFLKEQNIALNEHDEVKPDTNTILQKGMKISVKRAYPLTLFDGGEERSVWSTSTTVADFLKQQEISITDLDRVEPGLEDTLKENDTVNVIRVEKVTDVVEEPIQFATITKKDDSLASGSKKVITPGKEGLTAKTYEMIKENGKEVSRKVINEKMLKEKQDQVVAVGPKEVSQNIASRGSESGKEIFVTSTAYTANCSGCSGTTATGLNLHANPNSKVIAVDPRVIPLGTKVHVEGYGYAIAADTGGAIKGNKIDVFFPSKQTAMNWGRKKVKIKILN